MKHLPERIEAHCPRCNASFAVSPAAQTRKIQCPNCRRAIALAVAPEPAPPGDSIGERLTALEARVARQEALIEQLRAQKAPTTEAAAPSPTGDSLLAPGRTLRWLQRDARVWTGAECDPEQHGVLLHNLRAMGQREISVQSITDDPIGHRLAAELTATFREAGWKVSAPEPIAGRRPIHGLVVAAGQCPMPPGATAAYMALQASGFPTMSRLDSSLGPDQWILIAGCSPANAD